MIGSDTSNESSAWLVKLDSSGNVIWNQTYAGLVETLASSVVQTSDGGYAIAGATSSSSDILETWLAKTDSSGNLQWDQAYSGTGESETVALIQSSDGGYAMLCMQNIDYDGQFGGAVCLIKTDANGVTSISTPTPTPSITPAPTFSPTPTPSPTSKPTASPAPTPTATPTPTSTTKPVPTSTPTPTATSKPTPALTSTPSPTFTPSQSEAGPAIESYVMTDLNRNIIQSANIAQQYDIKVTVKNPGTVAQTYNLQLNQASASITQGGFDTASLPGWLTTAISLIGVPTQWDADPVCSITQPAPQTVAPGATATFTFAVTSTWNWIPPWNWQYLASSALLAIATGALPTKLGAIITTEQLSTFSNAFGNYEWFMQSEKFSFQVLSGSNDIINFTENAQVPLAGAKMTEYIFSIFASMAAGYETISAIPLLLWCLDFPCWNGYADCSIINYSLPKHGVHCGSGSKFRLHPNPRSLNVKTKQWYFISKSSCSTVTS